MIIYMNQQENLDKLHHQEPQPVQEVSIVHQELKLKSMTSKKNI